MSVYRVPPLPIRLVCANCETEADEIPADWHDVEEDGYAPDFIEDSEPVYELLPDGSEVWRDPDVSIAVLDSYRILR